ncbi:hypothetical protein BIY26_22625 [Brenneria goodwinii]|uniref:PAAR domain-containing protein n=1 Tax=Brenneria goodwinii TaxID=1109412 RepID=A0AAE8EKC4_9GAMM|nr:PAAR domain-containing protein [Brenneria goodwinii]ATA23327.1 hypothetical protein AWC36_03965 [Brenneria goodwinii]RLM16016.1 hypothetical protein BIY26_22625 [Brenneria goodwinii]
MTKKLACLGDPTTNGNIVTASSSYFEQGKKVAQSGDMATCRSCKGTFPIMGSCDGIMDGATRLVQDQDRVMCRCPNHRVVAQAQIFNQ